MSKEINWRYGDIAVHHNYRDTVVISSTFWKNSFGDYCCEVRPSNTNKNYPTDTVLVKDLDRPALISAVTEAGGHKAEPQASDDSLSFQFSGTSITRRITSTQSAARAAIYNTLSAHAEFGQIPVDSVLKLLTDNPVKFIRLLACVAEEPRS